MRYLDEYRVSVPSGRLGMAEISRFDVPKELTVQNLREAMYGRTPVPPGTWTRLTINGALWMTDTPAEIRDHMEAIRRIERGARRVLINGLGLGLVVQAALKSPSVAHVDVVERSEDVINLAEPHYQQMAAANGKTLMVHHADAYTMKWPSHTAWDVAWHDVWHSICADNLPTMARLHRMYGRRVEWQGSWCRHLCERGR